MAFRFESLEIWHMARDYARKTYEVTAKFPRHEDYGLRSQMNRAANSISLNLNIPRILLRGASLSQKGQQKIATAHSTTSLRLLLVLYI